MVRELFTVGFKRLPVYNKIIYKLIQLFTVNIFPCLPRQPELRYTFENRRRDGGGTLLA